MERTPLHDLSRDELIGLILRLQKQLADQEQRNRELAERNDELARRIEGLEKKNPAVRLDEAYSLRAEEERQAKAANEGKGKRNKQKSKRRGRISSKDKLAKATLEEDVWPKQFKFAECQWRYSRPVWRIINGQAVQAEIARWYDDSVSCFRRMVASLQIPERSLPTGVKSILDQLVPLPDTG